MKKILLLLVAGMGALLAGCADLDPGSEPIPETKFNQQSKVPGVPVDDSLGGADTPKPPRVPGE